MEKLVLVPYEKYQRLLDGKTMEKKTPNPPKRRERTVLKKRVHPGNGINRALRRTTPLKTGSRSELWVQSLTKNIVGPLLKKHSGSAHVSSAENICKQFGPRPELTECRS